ncbi:hypothetical protein FA13DRAFT_1766451 [Coprinellus micaceus]|uniref:Uncharacterized protein n=1 Tax=Coprinellus micaceus TaxID=71717 RepID=A0A4Y7SKG8_COPMI|nr:hypothetical protein FA13DRAFT_1766451 [Coprinellus micaceus]
MARTNNTFTSLLRTLLLTASLALLSPTLIAPHRRARRAPTSASRFDASWNLLAFNFDSKDSLIPSSAFTSSSSSSVTTTDITKPSGRPPFDAPSSPPLCYTSQFTNAIYVLNADAAGPVQTTLPPTSSTTLQSYNVNEGFGAILDRDTNVFYALTKGNLLMSLDMGLLKAANATALTWNEVQNPAWTSGEDGTQEGSGSGLEGYEFPTMALAQNHVHFVGGVPGLKEGEAKIFVIHYSYLQPSPQSYPSNSGSAAFPTTHGRTASFFRDDSVQTQFAYIPDDGSAAYVVDVTANSTTTLPGPPAKDAYAAYAASPIIVVYDQEKHQGASAWKSVDGWKGASNTPESAGGSGSASGAGAGASGTGSASGASGSGTKGASSGTVAGFVGLGML